jgi:cell division protease FtsH
LTDDSPLSRSDFGASFRSFLQQVARESPAEDPPFVRLLKAHFRTDPSELTIVTEDIAATDRPNLQVAMDAFLREEGRTAEVIGVTGSFPTRGVELAQLIAPAQASFTGMTPPSPGPLEYATVPLADGHRLACVSCGLFLIQDGAERLAALVASKPMSFHDERLHIQVMAPDRGSAERFLAAIRASMRKRNVYQGHVISLQAKPPMGELEVVFHDLPRIVREHIVLPEDVLARVERSTFLFSRHREKLLAASRHLKRGLLLHGPPGTGKTLTAMYIAGEMRDRTVLLLTGQTFGLLRQSCAMARLLAPSTLILEDIDLIAEERTHQQCTGLLFELLNEMDGLADDADILFLLTSNRPEILEPALAARPGRIDQAIEIPLPDNPCRRRLFELYGRGMKVRLSSLDRFLAQTEGVSAAFIREMLRNAAVLAAEDGEEIVVDDRHVEAALHELLVEGGALTQSLLGATRRSRS